MSASHFLFPPSLLQAVHTVCDINNEQLAAAHTDVPPVSVRLNPCKPSSVFNPFERIPWCNDGFYLPERISFIKDPLFHAGAYYVQEASSMFLEQVLKQHVDFSRDLRVLDLCASPGGKSTLINSLLNENSLLISNEVIKTRVGALAENLGKWGRSNVLVSNNDPKDFSSLTEYFDVIVVDAPCSGSGLFRKQEDAIGHWSEENVMHCSQRQQRILEDIMPALKPGGILIYSTCSYSPEENEEIADLILSPGQFISLRQEIKKEWGIVETQSKNQAFGYRFFPHLLKGEGFFIAAFKKSGEAEEQNFRSKKKSFELPSKEEAGIISAFVDIPGSARVIKQKEFFFLVSQLIEEDLTMLGTQLQIRKKGTLLGEIKGKDFIPHHELALSIHIHKHVSRLQVDETTALRFLKKSEIQANPDTPKGFCLVCFHDFPIGWIKNLGNRSNNYLPKEWRILTDIS